VGGGPARPAEEQDGGEEEDPGECDCRGVSLVVLGTECVVADRGGRWEGREEQEEEFGWRRARDGRRGSRQGDRDAIAGEAVGGVQTRYIFVHHGSRGAP
jgi:hypothetical protein